MSFGILHTSIVKVSFMSFVRSLSRDDMYVPFNDFGVVRCVKESLLNLSYVDDVGDMYIN